MRGEKNLPFALICNGERLLEVRFRGDLCHSKGWGVHAAPLYAGFARRCARESGRPGEGPRAPNSLCLAAQARPDSYALKQNVFNGLDTGFVQVTLC